MMMKLYRWQQECLQAWSTARYRGIAHVVTGAGKTFLALNAMDLYLSRFPDARIRIVVPTIPLAQQWQLALLHHVKDPALRPGFWGGGVHSPAGSRVMIYIVNSARDSLSQHIRRDFSLGRHVLLICDECHHYQSPQNRRIFDFIGSAFASGDQYAALGLSATPFDTPGDTILTKALGPEIYHYNVNAATSDGVVSPFYVCELAVHFLTREREEYEELSLELALLIKKLLTVYPELENLSSAAFMKAVHKIASAAGMDPQNIAVSFLLTTWKRKELSTLAYSRALCGVSLIGQLSPDERVLIFCERISQAEQMARILRRQFGNICSIYHSGMNKDARRRNMSDFRENRTRILVSCRCLDEGIDVPDATVGIILSGAAVTRQRIQRLGRILRRSEGKAHASLYYLYIQESAEDASFLPGLEAEKSFAMSFRSDSLDFENDLYVCAAMDLLRRCESGGYSDSQLRELRRCLLEGLVRADFLLPEEEKRRRASHAASRYDRNYWQAMRKLGAYFIDKTASPAPNSSHSESAPARES